MVIKQLKTKPNYGLLYIVIKYIHFFGVLISAPLLNLKRKFGLQTHNIHSVPTSIQIPITEKLSLLSGA